MGELGYGARYVDPRELLRGASLERWKQLYGASIEEERKMERKKRIEGKKTSAAKDVKGEVIKVKCSNGNCGWMEEISSEGIFHDSKYNQLTNVNTGLVRCSLCGAPVLSEEKY